MTILDELAEYAKKRSKNSQRIKPLEKIKKQALAVAKGDFSFEKTLNKPGISFICECKKASPSKGVIVKDFPYLEIAKEYEAAGGDCISVLTEPKWFLGKDSYLKEIAKEVKVPCLRKDFIIDEYMVYESRLLGAQAVLLICAILEKDQVKKYIEICDKLGISALVEVNNEKELEMAISSGARIIGVNNRNLKDFTVDRETSIRLSAMIPDHILFVAESGVKTAEDVQALREIGVDGILIGEALMTAENKRKKLGQLKGQGVSI